MINLFILLLYKKKKDLPKNNKRVDNNKFIQKSEPHPFFISTVKGGKKNEIKIKQISLKDKYTLSILIF